jgi:hypothetical protein
VYTCNSVGLLLEETGVGPHAGLKFTPPVLKGLEGDNLDAAGAGRAAKAGEEVEGILDDALGEDGSRGLGGRALGLAGGEFVEARGDGVGGLDADTDDEVLVSVAGGRGADLEDGALLAGADGAEEAEVGGGAGLVGLGDGAGGGKVNGGGGVVGQGDVGQQENEDVGEGAGGGESVEEGGGRGRRGRLGDQGLAGGDDAEQRAGHYEGGGLCCVVLCCAVPCWTVAMGAVVGCG